MDEDLAIRIRYLVKRLAEIAQESDQLRQRFLQTDRGAASEETSGSLQGTQRTPVTEAEHPRVYVQ